MVVTLVGSHGLDDRLRLLSRCRAVEVGKPVAVYPLAQGREVQAAVLDPFDQR
jgi:hypothetical protein